MKQSTVEELIHERCSLLPNDVYDNLPESLVKVLTPILDSPKKFAPKSKDALLMAALCHFSALMPGCSVLYGTNRYSLNNSFVYTGPAGCQKSVTNYADHITRGVNQHILELSLEKIKKWEVDNMAWEVEKKKAQQEKRPLDQSLNPGDRPEVALLRMPSSTSKSQLILSIAANEKYGLVLSSSEINSLADAIGKDYGNFADSLCKALANEPVDKYHRADGKPYIIERPMLSLILSGTFAQFQTLIPTFEDGLASRLWIMVGESYEEWIWQNPDYLHGSYQKLYEDVSEDALQMWKLYSARKMEVRFTNDQWEVFNTTWMELRKRLITEVGMDYVAIANRHAMNTVRLAAVFVMLRHWDATRSAFLRPTSFDWSSQPDILWCGDDDFLRSMSISTTLYEHALMMSTTKVQSMPKGTREMQDWKWTDEALGELPNQFTAMEFATVAETFDRARSTAYYALKNLVKRQVLSVKTVDGVINIYMKKKSAKKQR